MRKFQSYSRATPSTSAGRPDVSSDVGCDEWTRQPEESARTQLDPVGDIGSLGRGLQAARSFARHRASADRPPPMGTLAHVTNSTATSICAGRFRAEEWLSAEPGSTVQPRLLGWLTSPSPRISYGETMHPRGSPGGHPMRYRRFFWPSWRWIDHSELRDWDRSCGTSCRGTADRGGRHQRPSTKLLRASRLPAVAGERSTTSNETQQGREGHRS